jgi:TPR repeat protein
MKVLLQSSVMPQIKLAQGTPRFGSDTGSDTVLQQEDWELRSLARQGNNDARIALALRERGYGKQTSEFIETLRTMAEGGVTLFQYDYALTLYQASQPSTREQLLATFLFKKPKEVSDDLVESVKWFTIAAYKKNGKNYTYNPDRMLKHLKRTMPDSRFEEGQARANQWLRENPEFASRRW